MFSNYGEFVTELEGHYDNIINIVRPYGEKLTQILETEKSPSKVYILAHDTLRRLVSNIRVLRGIKISNDTCIVFRLILRATTADLIEAIYILTLSDEKRDTEIFNRELEAVRTLETYVTEKKQFYDSIDPNGCDIDLSKFYLIHKEFVNPLTGKLYPKTENKKMNTSDMGVALVKAGILSQEFCQMYTNYRILSLTEHYSPLARRFSYNNEKDELIFIDIVRWLVVGTDTLCKIVKEWLDKGNFSIS